MHVTWGLGLAIVLFSSSTRVMADAAEVTSRKVHCGVADRTYLYYSPHRERALPAVMLLHGAGDRADNTMDAWKRFAEENEIAVLAPELPRDLKFEEEAPRVFRCMVEDSKQFVAIDSQRVYIFGNSMGGYLAYDAAMFESQYFAAVAVHAMRIADEYEWVVSRAERKTPIAIYIGDHDRFFSQQSVRKTRDLLAKSGFPVHYVEMAHHDHNYYARADEINADAWKFLADTHLP